MITELTTEIKESFNIVFSKKGLKLTLSIVLIQIAIYFIATHSNYLLETFGITIHSKTILKHEPQPIDWDGAFVSLVFSSFELDLIGKYFWSGHVNIFYFLFPIALVFMYFKTLIGKSKYKKEAWLLLYLGSVCLLVFCYSILSNSIIASITTEKINRLHVMFSSILFFGVNILIGAITITISILLLQCLIRNQTYSLKNILSKTSANFIKMLTYCLIVAILEQVAIIIISAPIYMFDFLFRHISSFYIVSVHLLFKMLMIFCPLFIIYRGNTAWEAICSGLKFVRTNLLVFLNGCIIFLIFQSVLYVVCTLLDKAAFIYSDYWLTPMLYITWQMLLAVFIYRLFFRLVASDELIQT